MFTGHEEAPSDLNLPTTNCPEHPLFLNPKFSDVVFLVGEEKLHAHKAILAAKSKRFDRLFEENNSKKEITISNTSPENFRILLKYIYADIIAIPSDIEQMLQLLVLAHQHALNPLESSIIEKIENILDTNNVIFFVNGANNHGLDDLRDRCHSFIDSNAPQILSSESFSDLTQQSLTQIMKREHRLAPEIDIFKSVAGWCERNNNNVVLECVRLTLLTLTEMLFIVWPTKLVNPDKILESMSKIVGPSPRNLGVVAMDENIATVQCGAKVIFHSDSDILLTGNIDPEKHVKHTIEGESCIIIRLNGPCSFNNIRMKLFAANLCDYSYYIETSQDQKIWHRIVDYSSYPCRSVQNLYFDRQVSRYIKVVGTSSTVGKDFRLVSFETFYKSKIPRMQNGIICPDANVATPENGAIVVEGESPQDSLDGNHNNFTCHRIYSDQSGAIIVQLSQPYLVSSMRLLLRESCKYVIETSVNKRDWQIAIDRRNGGLFTEWEDLQFAERVVVFIKITGTYSREPGTQYFRCYHFELPSEAKKLNNERTQILPNSVPAYFNFVFNVMKG